MFCLKYQSSISSTPSSSPTLLSYRPAQPTHQWVAPTAPAHLTLVFVFVCCRRRSASTVSPRSPARRAAPTTVAYAATSFVHYVRSRWTFLFPQGFGRKENLVRASTRLWCVRLFPSGKFDFAQILLEERLMIVSRDWACMSAHEVEIPVHRLGV